MDSVQRKRHDIMPNNWRQYSDYLNQHLMAKAGIELESFEAAIFYGLAQSGESGELANVIKKMWRDGQSPELHAKMVGEIADVLIYLDHLMQVFRLQTMAVILKKVDELVNERYADLFVDFEPEAQVTN